MKIIKSTRAKAQVANLAKQKKSDDHVDIKIERLKDVGKSSRISEKAVNQFIMQELEMDHEQERHKVVDLDDSADTAYDPYML